MKSEEKLQKISEKDLKDLKMCEKIEKNYLPENIEIEDIVKDLQHLKIKKSLKNRKLLREFNKNYASRYTWDTANDSSCDKHTARTIKKR